MCSPVPPPPPPPPLPSPSPFYVSPPCSPGSTGAIPFLALLPISLMWMMICFPLGYCGGILASRLPLLEYPTRTNPIPREIPTGDGQRSRLVFMFFGSGLLTFGNIFVELYFAMTSMWQGYFYYLLGFVLVVGLLTVIITIQASTTPQLYRLPSCLLPPLSTPSADLLPVCHSSSSSCSYSGNSASSPTFHSNGCKHLLSPAVLSLLSAPPPLNAPLPSQRSSCCPLLLIPSSPPLLRTLPCSPFSSVSFAVLFVLLPLTSSLHGLTTT